MYKCRRISSRSTTSAAGRATAGEVLLRPAERRRAAWGHRWMQALCGLEDAEAVVGAHSGAPQPHRQATTTKA